jgi:hypothetical protein
MKRTLILSLMLAITIGLVIAWVDSRPHWDDTGVSAFMILCSATLCGYLSSQKPWLIALAIGIWIPLFGVIASDNFGTLLALVPAFIGAYIGYLIKHKFVQS